jgi:hypothetical protein
LPKAFLTPTESCILKSLGYIWAVTVAWFLSLRCYRGFADTGASADLVYFGN